jgi:hypothetical protein
VCVAKIRWPRTVYWFVATLLRKLGVARKREDRMAGKPVTKRESGLGAPSFTCPDCGATSYNRNDIREGYCGRCHDWTGDTPYMNARRASSGVPSPSGNDDSRFGPT